MTSRGLRPALGWLLPALLVALAPAAGSAREPTAPPRPPAIRIHYLGHSSFVFTFDNGVTILTDYGQSNAYGLQSPIHELGDLEPTIVTYSHHHPDHDRGRAFPGAIVLDGGRDLSLRGIVLKAVPVTEDHLGDNHGYLISYKGTTLFHAGDAQGDIAAISDKAVQDRLKRYLPRRLDVLLVPVGWTRPITREAAAYVDRLRPLVVIPMHYWSAEEKARFLARLGSRGKRYTVSDLDESLWDVAVPGPRSATRVIGLKPGPWGR